MTTPDTFKKYQDRLKQKRELTPAKKAEVKNQAATSCLQAMARQSGLHFMEYCWQQPNNPMVVGRHTREINTILDKAIENFKNGISSYISIAVPYRHGKSDASSRFLPARFVGEFPDDSVIVGTYGAGLSEKFSRDTKRIMEGEPYKELYETRLSKKTDSARVRAIENHNGEMIYVGADGGATGNGASLLVIDDFFKNRKEAESETLRNSRWESFSNDFFSRIAPVHIVIVLNTRWHVDDISGRIKNRNDKDHEDFDPLFPKFKQIVFPAMYEDGTYLFPERFDDHWYQVQFAMLGGVNSYAANCLLQGDPTTLGVKFIKTDKIKYTAEMPDDIFYVRSWDLASTEEERNSDDPDYTFGICVAVRQNIARDLLGKTIFDDSGDPARVYQIYIEDGKYCREEAPKRDALIRMTALEDGAEVWQGTESVAGYKDKYTTLKKTLEGVRVVRKITLKGDKVIRASVLEPIFLMGNVYINGNASDDPWVAMLIKHISEFPNGAHDDGIDALVNGFNLALQRASEAGISSGAATINGDDPLWGGAAV
jgi:predicted phage terminase large subunit-like protein